MYKQVLCVQCNGKSLLKSVFNCQLQGLPAQRYSMFTLQYWIQHKLFDQTMCREQHYTLFNNYY